MAARSHFGSSGRVTLDRPSRAPGPGGLAEARTLGPRGRDAAEDMADGGVLTLSRPQGGSSALVLAGEGSIGTPRGLSRSGPRSLQGTRGCSVPQKLQLERSLPSWPLGGADDLFAKFFAEVTLDAVEEQSFKRRLQDEVGPRYVHLRLNDNRTVSMPPHVEDNSPGMMGCQLWTGHPKVDRTMFIMDRSKEQNNKCTGDLAAQRNVPALRASSLQRKNFGRKHGPRGLDDSFRARVLNRPKKEPISTAPRSAMDMV